MANMTFNANLLPKTDLGFDLGSSEKRWNIYGDLTGDASTVNGHTVAKDVPANAVFTDTKVTAVGNHYTPSGGEALTTSNGTASAYALNTEYTVLTGVTITTDAAGHVTGVATTRQKVKDTNTTYTLPLAANGTRGGIQIGYTASGKNYPVQLSSEKAYVNVPWTDTDTKQNIKSQTANTKAYVTGVETSTAFSTTAQALTGVADTGVYLTAAAGEISAARHSWNVSGTEKAYTVYNSTTDAIDFIFV